LASQHQRWSEDFDLSQALSYPDAPACALLGGKLEDRPDDKKDDKKKRSGVHIMKKNDINALAAHAAIQNPSDLLVFKHATLNFAVKRMLPLANPLKLTKPHVQRAYGSSDSPETDYERLLFDLNMLLPVTALLRVGPYVVPLLVMRFVIDKTGRFLALVTCPWSPSHDVFSVFHFFKNMLHMLHQMDKDDRFSLLRDFGESQVDTYFSFPSSF